MADLTISPDDVRLTTTVPQIDLLIAGEAIDAGEVSYRNTSGRHVLAQADDAATVNATHIALTNAAGDGSYFVGVRLGQVALGSVLTAGVVYCVSALNPGKIAPISDLGGSDYVTIVGVPASAAILDVRFNATGHTG